MVYNDHIPEFGCSFCRRLCGTLNHIVDLFNKMLDDIPYRTMLLDNRSLNTYCNSLRCINNIIITIWSEYFWISRKNDKSYVINRSWSCWTYNENGEFLADVLWDTHRDSWLDSVNETHLHVVTAYLSSGTIKTTTNWNDYYLSNMDYLLEYDKYELPKLCNIML